MEHTKGELKFVRSPKHKGAIFIKIKDTKDNFICKVYPKKNWQETEANAQIIFAAFERANQNEKLRSVP